MSHTVLMVNTPRDAVSLAIKHSGPLVEDILKPALKDAAKGVATVAVGAVVAQAAAFAGGQPDGPNVWGGRSSLQRRLSATVNHTEALLKRDQHPSAPQQTREEWHRQALALQDRFDLAVPKEQKKAHRMAIKVKLDALQDEMNQVLGADAPMSEDLKGTSVARQHGK